MAPTFERASPEFYFLSAVHRIKLVQKDVGAEAYFKHLESCLEELNWNVTVKTTYTRILQRAKADLDSAKIETRSRAYSTASNAVIVASAGLGSPQSHRKTLTKQGSANTLNRLFSIDSRTLLLGGPHKPLNSSLCTSSTSGKTSYPSVDENLVVQEEQEEVATQVNERDVLLGGVKARSKSKKGARVLFAETPDTQCKDLETDLLDLAQEMKGVAGKFGVTIGKSKKVLDDMGNLVDSNADRIKRENTTARKLLKSNTLSFFKTMIMLIVSVIIFCFMVPFIFATSIIN
eukprot:GEMP01044618.1.p1 GENE.GEMP01044618.1~~GEMP01044618.1.p1  ORF type:complete len:330 (+),score=45.04 GEMP01044618.1:123-992(+)